ncbi:Na+ dependent nucleoside transporter C-terminus-domain-containing protein [Podospora aff. communis PSN243]|uniref:Na+ dependent nucleoside transporter C-terminus-domain-containing protein n=1 Tax=Podospora aff. communis PSN243 TaxID=3040156 RepID=A0AAV9GEW2_9PEZI|nr:Na+ dependent nucleoside transporter C-terminus-domain-containing protein [Podospora aff. communis PSN243]
MNSQLPIQGDALDAIRAGPPQLVSGSNRRGSQSSKSSAGSPNEKKSLPDQQFDVDPENQSDKVGSVRREDAEMDAGERRKFTIKLWAKRAWLAVFFLLMTAWWIFGLVKRRHTEGLGWLKPTLIYLAITIRYIFWLVPSRLAMAPIRSVWQNTAGRVYHATPSKLRQPLAAVLTVAVFLLGTFIPEETGDNTRASRAISIFGLLVMIAILAASSRDFRRIPWHTVIGGMLTQFIIAVFVLRTKAGYDIFAFISEMARTLLGFAMDGLVFLTEPKARDLTWFLSGVIPPIIFFIALVQALYHLGFLQWFVQKFAVFFFWSLRVSGAEAVVAAATPFIGQGESAMLIRPFLPHLTMAEIHQIMTCGFATIAGSVLVAYIGLGLNPQALVSSCIMSIPASLAISKLRYPETEQTLTSGKVEVPDDEEHHAVNWIHAFANGAWLGIKIGATIVACLLCVIALVSLVNGLLGWWGKYWGAGLDGGAPLSLELILGYLLFPVAWLLGVPNKDVLPVARLIGSKIIANEFVAFHALTTMEPYLSMSPRSIIIATYAVCGFGNISSLGIQIGILSQLAPKRSGDVVRVAGSALICGIIATLSSASIAGMLFHDGMITPPS